MTEEVRQKKIKVELSNDHYTIYNGSMLDMLEVIQPNSIDSIVCDPPYELNFMNKGWDNGGISFNPDTWKKCYEVLKPGGYLLAFGGSRTFHRIAVAIEDAGFEIRDTIMWLYGSGFPKSLNVAKAISAYERTGGSSPKIKNDNKKVELTDQAKQWQGWGTALKPAYEPIIVARKPFKGSLVENVLNYGVGGLNIDECRVGDEMITTNGKGNMSGNTPIVPQNKDFIGESHYGRFPANIIHDGSEETTDNMQDASRYFYTAKASKKDRDEGLGGFKQKQTTRKNIHPTVKPCELMQYLVRLVSPKGATILDPFMGSGSTGKAVMFENRERNANYKFIGIDLEEKYCQIAIARIDYALNKFEYDYIKEKQEASLRGQANIFDFIEVN